MSFLKFFKKTTKPEIIIPKESVSDHKHEWNLIAKTYATPLKNIQLENAGVHDSVTIERYLMGVTTLLWECLICHQLRKEELLGSDIDTLDELLNKTDQYGNQFIQRDGNTFVIAKYIPPNTQPGNVPLR